MCIEGDRALLDCGPGPLWSLCVHVCVCEPRESDGEKENPGRRRGGGMSEVKDETIKGESSL